MDITLTIQIVPEGDRERREAVYHVLDGWRKASMSMGNLAMLHLMTQENITNMIYLAEGIKAKLGNKGENAIFKTSRQNATYRILAHNDLPSDIINNVNARAVAYFNKHKQEIFKGKMRVPYYTNNAPIPFSKESIRFYAEKSERRRLYKFKLFKHVFNCVLGKDKAGYSYQLDGILNHTVAYKNASLYFNKRNRKWFLLLPIPAEQARPALNQQLICYAELTPDIPISASFGDNVIQIGDIEEFEYRRKQISEKLRRLQIDSRFSRGGHGRKQKLQAIERFAQKEVCYVRDKLHKYSAALVGTCVRKGYGTIIINRKKPDNDENDIYRYWSAAELVQFIKYKATAKGISVIAN